MTMQPPRVPPDPRRAPPPLPAALLPMAVPPAMPIPAGDLVIELSFWQHPFVQNVLPFLTSLVLHISLLVLGLLTVQVVKTVVFNPPKEQIIIPESDVTVEGPEGGVPHPGMGGDPTRDAAQDKFPDVPKDSKGLAEKPGPSLIPTLMGGGGGDADAGGTIIGIGPGGLGSGIGIGSGKGAGIGSGDGDGSGVLAPFGIPGGGVGLAPKASFIGHRGIARRIAYVCDASGSMLNMFDSLRIEIRKSVENLKPIQSFNVIFFQDQGVATVDKSNLMPANPENKRKSYDFLDKFFVKGATNPIPALELAFSQNPQLIFLLTDGDFSGPGNEAVVTFCKQKTANGLVKISTLAFINKDSTKDNPQDLEFVKALQAIAKNSGGQFRYVSDDDMGQK